MAAVDQAQRTALERLFTAPLLWSEDDMGDCYSAHSALQMARVIAHLTERDAADSDDAAERAGLVVAVDPDGAVGVVVVVTCRGATVAPNITELASKELSNE